PMSGSAPGAGLRYRVPRRRRAAAPGRSRIGLRRTIRTGGPRRGGRRRPQSRPSPAPPRSPVPPSARSALDPALAQRENRELGARDNGVPIEQAAQVALDRSGRDPEPRADLLARQASMQLLEDRDLAIRGRPRTVSRRIQG